MPNNSLQPTVLPPLRSGKPAAELRRLAVMTKEQSPSAKYNASFAGEPKDKTKAAKALEFALDVRKFEIDLYWNRAAYFWAFTGAALAGYLTVLTGKEVENRADALLIVSCLGLIFSVAWYFVNRASKFWQANWEAHVDVLEDQVMGPMYKTLLQDRTSFWRLGASYPFSVSKINQLLSLIVVLVFAGLVLRTLQRYYVLSKDWELFPTSCVALTLGAIAVLFFLGRTGETDRKVALYRRTTEITEYHSNDG